MKAEDFNNEFERVKKRFIKMRTKKITIEIKPLKNVLGEFAIVFDKVKRGEKVQKSDSIGFENIETFRKFFSQKRLELLSVIKNQQPRSIYELAKLTKREYKNVYDDVSLLESLGLVEKGENNLSADFSKLLIELSV